MNLYYLRIMLFAYFLANSVNGRNALVDAPVSGVDQAQKPGLHLLLSLKPQGGLV